MHGVGRNESLGAILTVSTLYPNLPYITVQHRWPNATCNNLHQIMVHLIEWFRASHFRLCKFFPVGCKGSGVRCEVLACNYPLSHPGEVKGSSISLVSIFSLLDFFPLIS